MPVLLSGIGLFFVSLILFKFALAKRKLFFWIIFLFCLFCSFIFIYIAHALADYRIVKASENINDGTLAAMIECRKVTGKIYDAEFLIKYVDAKDNNFPEKFLLAGNQWSIQGKVLLIKSLFDSDTRYFIYKITCINAKFLNPRNASESPQLAYNINRTDRLWDFFKKHNFDFIRAFSTTTKYRRIDKLDQFNLYLAPSGFDIKKSK